jgi:D-sedoheptulose 7-phosphate isomerase
MYKNFIEKEFDVIAENFIKLKALSQDIDDVANTCIEAIKQGNKIIFCGNGGSASDS